MKILKRLRQPLCGAAHAWKKFVLVANVVTIVASVAKMPPHVLCATIAFLAVVAAAALGQRG